MRKIQIYLDTTVPSAYYDDRVPYRQQLTRQFWNECLQDFNPVISTLVTKEINDTPDMEKRKQLQHLIQRFEVLSIDEEASRLAQEYVQRGIFPEKYESDANHVAIAVVNGIGYLLSWNFRHLVKVATRREVNLVNAIAGYGQIEIIAPPEL
jgi:predicted nucleic acid-binding protein